MIAFRFVFLSFFFFFLIVPAQINANEVSLSDELIKKTDTIKLYKDKEWLNLLHYDGKKSIVDKDSHFFISPTGYKNPKHEMHETIRAFFDSVKKDDAHAICQFPSRFEFILKKTGFLSKNLKSQNCHGYNEFKQKVPMDSVAIVFASENNTVPTSIMGHIFVKLSGLSNGVVREHAFSYFATDVDTRSFKFYRDVLISSIDGMYVLSPYSNKRDNYLYFEQRPIWEIELNLDDQQRSYLHKHMWELKNVNVGYSFIFHNCGTASINLFNIIYKDFELSGYKFFETPIDYINRLNEKGKVKDVFLIPSPEYHLKMIRDSYSFKEIYEVRTNSQNLSDKQKYLANALHNYHESSGMISNDIYKNIAEKDIDVEPKVKNILDAKPSSQVSFKYSYFNKDGVEMEFMPIYQNIFDVSKAYFDDFETKIMNFNFVYGDKFYINRFDAVSLKSIVDASMATNIYSKYARISFENALGEEGFNLRPVAEAGLGYSYAFLNQRFKPYILPKVGYRYDNYNNFYIVPEIGLILKPIDDVKAIFSYEKYFESKDNNRGFDEKISANVSYLLSKNTTLYLEYNKYSGTTTKKDNELRAGVGFSF